VKKYDLSVTTGKYQVQGVEKFRNKNVGEVHENQKGYLYARLDAFTLLGACMAAIAKGEDSLSMNMYAPRNQDENRGNKAAPSDDFDDDIAF
jgi:hypothetical protein